MGMELSNQKRAAAKRVAEAESESLVQEQGQAAKQARRAELAHLMAYLDLIEDISSEQRTLLAVLATNGMPMRACLATGVSPNVYYGWVKNNDTFKTLVEECKKMSADRLEQVAIDLATGEYMRPLVSQGRIAAYERIYDSRALITLLKAKKPTEFASRIDVTSNGHSIVKLVDKESWDAL